MNTKTVSQAALVARIKRHLKSRDCALCKTRPQDFATLGEFCIVDASRNVIDHDIDLEQFAADAGLLHAGECLAV